MPAAKDLTGRRFGRLFVIGRDPVKERAIADRRAAQGMPQHPRAYWKCRCDCGASTSVLGAYLTGGGTRSCGCLRRETGREHAERMRRILSERGQAYGRLDDAFAEVFDHKAPAREVDARPKRWRGARPAALALAACLGLAPGGRP